MRAALHEGPSDCDNGMGTVLTVVNNKLFTIETCNDTRTYTEFTYCHGVKEGDKVIFDGRLQDCEFVSFTVLNNGAQCAVWCP